MNCRPSLHRIPSEIAPSVCESQFDRWWFEERWDLLLEPAERRLVQARAEGCPDTLAEALERMAVVLQHLRGPAHAVSLCWEAYRLRRRLGDADGIATAAGLLIWNLALASDLSRVFQLIPQAMRAYRAAGMEPDGFLLLAHLGEELVDLNRFSAASLIFEQALPRAPHRYPCWGRAGVLQSLSVAHEHSGNLPEAIQAAHAAEQALAELGFHAEAENLRARAQRLSGILGQSILPATEEDELRTLEEGGLDCR